MKNGTLYLEVFNSDDFNLEYREEIIIPSTLLQMKLSTGMKGADYILIDDFTDKENNRSLRVRVIKENQSYNPNGPKDSPKNFKFWNLAKFELNVLSAKGLVKGQQLLRDDRLVRVSFIPD